MASRKWKILFITPLASRTGSEMVLWHVLRNFDRSKFEVALASYSRGELLEQVPADVKTYLIPGTFDTFDRISYHLGRHPVKSALKSAQRDFKADFWYLNTIVLPKAAETAVEMGIPFIVHFHEMPLSYVYVNSAEFNLMMQKAFHCIGCSDTTCEGILQAGGRAVSRLYEFIDTDMGKAEKTETDRIRGELGIQKDDFVWMMSGVASERKGFDYFPDLAAYLDSTTVHLVWVGSLPEDGYVTWVVKRICEGSRSTRIHLAGKQTDAYAQYFHLADGFVLTSRQDPFPLVMIEAASQGIPIVAFPSGGISEFLLPGMGLVTEDFSVRQLGAAMQRVMSGEWVREAGLSRARASEFNTSEGVERWNRLMTEILTETHD